jgi:hypothetical protein
METSLRSSLLAAFSFAYRELLRPFGLFLAAAGG